jgi:hypothetical protein
MSNSISKSETIKFDICSLRATGHNIQKGIWPFRATPVLRQATI